MIKHIFVRGNYRDDLFFDQIDLVNAWNRVWLSAESTGTKILAVEILSNHFHICAKFDGSSEKANVTCFMRHLRMSLSSYFNRRHRVKGSFGNRLYGIGHVLDPCIDGGSDLRDLICYIHRNVVHHKLLSEYRDWKYSTFCHLYGMFSDLKSCYSSANLPKSMFRKFFPTWRDLPAGWAITRDGLVVPPEGIFLRAEVESLFGNILNFYRESDNRTRRERMGEANERKLESKRLRIAMMTDEQISEFILEETTLLPVEMDRKQRHNAVLRIKDKLQWVSAMQLSRVFGVPYGTIRRWLEKVSTN